MNTNKRLHLITRILFSILFLFFALSFFLQKQYWIFFLTFVIFFAFLKWASVEKPIVEQRVELNKKIWYRLLKVIAVLLLVGAFISPWLIHKPNSFLIIDSFINLVIWIVLIYITKNIILYVLYGKKESIADKGDK